MPKTQKKEKSMEAALWESANKLRGNVEPSEYKHVVLSLIFLKYASDKFEDRRKELIDEGKGAYVEMVDFYTMKNVFYLAPESRWSYIMEQSKQSDIALKIDTALYTIEKINPSLRGALPDNYYSRLGLDTAKLASLLDEINKIELTKDNEQDVMGRVYEYFLSNFALQEGKGKGEFYTPKCIVNLIAELIEPYQGKIYDPCCGSGGMFVQSAKFIQAHSGSRGAIAVYGQEANADTWKMAKINMAIRGIDADFGAYQADTFTNDLHPTLKADFVLANPPFGARAAGSVEIHRSDFIKETKNNQINFLQHIMSLLKSGGRAGVVLPDNVLFESSGEEVRKKLLTDFNLHTILRLPTGIFYANGVQTNVLFFEKKGKTKELWVYDYRSGIKHTLATNPLKREDLDDFVSCFSSEDRNKREETYNKDTNPNGRWRKFSIEEILEREGTNLDLSWIKNDSDALEEMKIPELLKLLTEKKQNISDAVTELQKELVECKL